MYGEGTNRLGELIDLGVSVNLVKKAGSWYSIGEDKIGQGKSNAVQYFKDNPDVATEIEAKVRAELMGVPGSVMEDAPEVQPS